MCLVHGLRTLLTRRSLLETGQWGGITKPFDHLHPPISVKPPGNVLRARRPLPHYEALALTDHSHSCKFRALLRTRQNCSAAPVSGLSDHEATLFGFMIGREDAGFQGGAAARCFARASITAARRALLARAKHCSGAATRCFRTRQNWSVASHAPELPERARDLVGDAARRAAARPALAGEVEPRCRPGRRPGR